jgi:hypothetical protein
MLTMLAGLLLRRQDYERWRMRMRKGEICGGRSRGRQVVGKWEGLNEREVESG